MAVGKFCFCTQRVNSKMFRYTFGRFLVPAVKEQFNEEPFFFQAVLLPSVESQHC